MNKPISLALILFRASERPSIADANILAVLKQTIETINPATIAIIFTFCDQDPTFNIDYAHEWYHEGLIEGIEGMP